MPLQLPRPSLDRFHTRVLSWARQHDNATRCAACRRFGRAVPWPSDRASLSTTSRRHERPGKHEGPVHPGEAHHDVVDGNLPSQAEHRRSRLSKRFSSVMDNVQSNIFQASQRLNDLTGYSGIESLKRSIEAQEAHVQERRAAVRAAKDAYSSAIAQRSASQREVNELLQRKHAWTSHDLERFTALYRSDHANEQAEAKAAESLAEAERGAEEAGAKLSRSILARYHEEQIWSDKIRRMSTWGTWGLMGVNVLLFVIFQVGVEPWRRKRLVNGFEEKVREAIERERLAPVSAASSDSTDGLDDTSPPHLPSHSAVVDDSSRTGPLEDTHPGPSSQSPPLSSPGPPSSHAAIAPHPEASSSPLSYFDPCPSLPSLETNASTTPLFQRYSPQKFLAGLFGSHHVSLRQSDITIIALESFAAGATVCAIVCFGVLRRG